MNVLLNIISLSLNVINVIIHLVGASLLIFLYRNCRQKPQRLYVVNLVLISNIHLSGMCR